MLTRFFADVVLVIHAAFIAFAVVGGLLTLRWPRVAWIHLPAAVWAATVVAMGWICPLTPLENALRRAAGEAGYAGGFIEHYVVPLVYPAGLTREVQVVLGAMVVAVNLAIYATIWLRAKRRLRAGGP